MRYYGKISLTMSDIVVYLLHIDLIRKHSSTLFSFCDEDRKAKANCFVQEKDRLLCIGAGYLLKRCLPEGPVKVSPGGKPYLADGPYFNLSHSGEYVLLGISKTREIGVDIERINPSKIDGIRFVLNEEEKRIADEETLFRIWTNKESLTKCKGTGIQDIKSVNGLPLEGLRIFDEEHYYTTSTTKEGYALSITLKGEEPFQISIKLITALEE